MNLKRWIANTLTKSKLNFKTKISTWFRLDHKVQHSFYYFIRLFYTLVIRRGTLTINCIKVSSLLAVSKYWIAAIGRKPEKDWTDFPEQDNRKLKENCKKITKCIVLTVTTNSIEGDKLQAKLFQQPLGEGFNQKSW